MSSVCIQLSHAATPFTHQGMALFHTPSPHCDKCCCDIEETQVSLCITCPREDHASNKQPSHLA